MPLSTITNPFLDPSGAARSNVYSPAANTIAITTSALERVRVDPNGNMGVGTTTLTNKLNVAGAIQSSAVLTAVAANTIAMSQEAGFGRVAAFGPDTSTPGVLDLYVISTNGGVQKGLRIDSSGRLIMASQPAFRAYKSAGPVGTSEAPVQYDTVDFNIGGHYNNSTYRFTAPVSGRYFMTAMFSFYSQNDSRQIEVMLRLNGGTYQSTDCWIQLTQGNNTHTNATVSAVMNLTAGDYVQGAWTSSQATITFYSSGIRNTFSGYLIG
jgi:hypothetical protein